MKFKKIFVLSALSIFVLPIAVFASVKINEVAWMGNDKSQYGEWIELYNDGGSAVDLKDAALYEGGGTTLIIKLTKSIDPGGYYLIARSTPSTPDPVNGLADDLGSFGGSGLSNSGEYLVLKSSTGEVIDSVNAASGWPAGDSTTKQTMQLSGGGWITATGTPRAVNFTPTSDSGSGTSNSTTANSGSSNTNSGSTSNPLDSESGSLSAHSSPAPLSEAKEDVRMVASAGRDRLTLVDVPVFFEEKMFTIKGDTVDGGDVTWSFGDGEIANGKNITHTYKFAGDYAVVMNVVRAGENFVARTNVRVIKVDIDISDVGETYVKIKNGSTYEVNLGGWQLAAGKSYFVFPKDTIIFPKKEITLSKDVLGLSLDGELKLVSPAKNVVSKFKVKKEEPATQLSAANSIIATTSKEENNLNEVAAVLLSAKQDLLDAQKILNEKSRATEVFETPSQVASNSGEVRDTKIEIQPAPKQKNVEVIEKPRSLLKTVLDLPINGLRFIKSLFF